MDLPRSALGSLAIIAGVVGCGAAAFAYTAGWLSPSRLTPDKMVDAFRPPSGEARGHRRNHAKGVCFTGTFTSNGQGAELSKASVFSPGTYPVVGRFNLGVADPNASDATARVRGVGIKISLAGGEEWRTAMIDLPFFPVSTPQAFYENLLVSASKDPNAMASFAKAHPEIAAFQSWVTSAPWTGSYAEEQYNSINTFRFIDKSGAAHAVRWSLQPAAEPIAVTPADLVRRGSDFLEPDLRSRVAQAPVRWSMIVTVAGANDPTADPSKVWPADRRKLQVGELEVKQVEPERDGPCREVNFDPTVLPDGIQTSDDPFPAARSSAYAKSYDRRTAEESSYPHSSSETAR